MPDFESSVEIDATPEQLYALVSDLPRMGEWSPECTHVTWSSGTTYAVPGARFIGHNQVGVFRWFTQGVVVDASPGSRFSFRIHFGPMPISFWSYDLAAGPAGCVVTESWTDLRPKAYSYPARLIFGSRTARNRAGIRHTLQALKSSAEALTP
jgi:hypothetical protein